MYIRKYLLLAALLFSITLQAQVITKPAVLAAAAQGFAKQYKANLQKAIKMAKLKGWPLQIAGTNESMSYLVGLDNAGFPKYYTTFNNTVSAATTRADQLWPGGSSGLNLSGSSSFMKDKLGIWDGGSILGSHVELTGRIQQIDNPTSVSSHATHVAGTMIASGVNPPAKGMSFGAPNLKAWDFNQDIDEIAGNAANLLVSNHSYGILSGWTYNSSAGRWEFRGEPGATEDFKFGYYSEDAQSLDSIAYNAPYYLIVKAAGNSRNQNGPAVGTNYFRYDSNYNMIDAGPRPDGMASNNGYDIIPWDANAKNILTIGAVNGLQNGYAKPSDVVISSFSSWGPTDDGRIKPDVVGAGVGVLSSVSSADDAYGVLSGTSMASPNVSGSLFLLQEHFAKTNAGQFMRSATLKGLAIHTADEAGNNPGPDYIYGWGLLNVLKASEVISSNNNGNHLLKEENLLNGTTKTYNVVASGKGKLVATISWTDVKGPVEVVNYLNNRTPRLVNDLDIRVTRNGKTYFPWKLDVLNPANAATKGDNIVDNVEKIEIDSVSPGQTYTITVSHKGSLANGSQAYSLLVSGVGGNALCTSAPNSNGGSRIDSVVIGNYRINNIVGCTTYNDYTSAINDVQPGQTLSVKLGYSSCDASSLARIAKIFIDYNCNNQFEANEEVAVSTSLAGTNGIYATNINLPTTLTVGNYMVMRIVLQETNSASTVFACGNYGKGETQDYLLRVVSPNTDIAITELVTPTNGVCSNNAQLLTVQLQNKGINDVSNITVAATIKDLASNTTVATLSSVYAGTIASGSIVNYTLQPSFNAVEGKNYSIFLQTTLTGDQLSINDTITAKVLIAAKPSNPNGTAKICGTTAYLKVTNSATGTNYFWYDGSSSTNPIAVGNNTSTTIISTNKTYYLSSGTKGSIGLTSKYVYTSGTGGGYVTSGTGNYIKYTANVPVILESARLYSRYPGKVNIYAMDIVNGSYVYLSSVVIDIYATSKNLFAGAATNDATDTGAIFQINLPLPAGSHNILVVPQGNANIFRNNNIPSSNPTYPMSIANVFSLTGNSGGTPNSFYYYLYDMKINTQDCLSDRTAVVGTDAPLPIITQQGNNLLSSSASGNQWYSGVGGANLIQGATSNSYSPSTAGIYTVAVTDADGCTRMSADFSYNPLPIQLLNFNGIVNKGIANLVWSTATEVNASKFDIEFSTNGIDFVNVGTVAAAGNSSGLQQYSFEHKVVQNAGKYYYKLKLVDKDGSFAYSNTIILIENNIAKKISLYPNPIQMNKSINLQWSGVQTGTYAIKLLDIVGKTHTLQKIAIGNTYGNTVIQLPANVKSGVYQLQIVNANQSYVQKLIVQ